MNINHVKKVLRSALGPDIADRSSDAHELFATGLRYARLSDTEARNVDRTLANAGLSGIARMVLRESHSLVEAGVALEGYQQQGQARAAASALLRRALRMIIWHERDYSRLVGITREIIRRKDHADIVQKAREAIPLQ